MRVLLDMNMSPRWIAVLEAEGHEVVHWSTMGDPAATDEEVMNVARAGDFVVLTHDLDFTTILATSKANKPSVIQFRGADIRPETGRDALVRTLQVAASELERGALLTLDQRRMRVHVLPIGAES